MKTNNLIAIAMASLLSAGCAQNEITDISPDAAPMVGFNVYATPQTRGTVTDNSTTGTGIKNATGFGVLAYYTGQSAWSNTGSFTPNFMWNQQVTWNASASTWTYTPVKYWPNTEGDKISFFAYAPYEAAPTAGTNQGVVLSANTLTGAPTLRFTMKTAVKDQVDLVATNASDATHTAGANQVMNVQKRTTVAAFKFDHVLTRVNFKAKLDATPETGTHIFVTGMRLQGNSANNGTTFYSAATYKFADGTWDYTIAAPTTQSSNYEIGGTPNGIMNLASQTGTVTGYTTQSVKITSITTGDNLLTTNQYLFLIPPVNTTGIAADKVKAQVDYDIVTVDSKLSGGFSKTSTSATVSLPAGTLVKGKAYDYLFTIGLEQVQISATVTDWTNPTANIAIPSVDATATTIPATIGMLNTTKAGNPNCNYFVVNITSGTVSAALNLSTAVVTNFKSGDQIEIKLPAAVTMTSVTVPTGWQVVTGGTGSTTSIIIKKN